MSHPEDKEIKFFFEEDPRAEDSGISWEEHADTFFNSMGAIGVEGPSNIDSLAPMTPEVIQKTQKFNNKIIEIEFGVVASDYVIHITPVHPKKNLVHPQLLSLSMQKTMTILNKVVPYSTQVHIFKPRDDWEIKVTTYKIIDGAEAWNLDHKKIETEIIPEIVKAVTECCMKAS